MHQFKLQRSTIAVGLACAAVLTLSGCAATSITGSTAVPAAEASAKKMKAEPVKISMPGAAYFDTWQWFNLSKT